MIYGHTAARQELPSRELVMLYGPAGTGKFSLAAEIAAELAPTDHHIYRTLGMVEAREFIDLVTLMPTVYLRRIFVVDLDNATRPALTALLKTLEEPPPYSQIWLAASRDVPATIMSRVPVVPCAALNTTQVAAAMTTLGVPYNAAESIAGIAEGSVAVALRLQDVLGAQPRVLGLLRAIARRNWSLCGRVLRGADEDGQWTDAHCDALMLWLADILGRSQRWYPEGDQAHGVGAPVLLATYAVLDGPGRPSLRMARATLALMAR